MKKIILCFIILSFFGCFTEKKKPEEIKIKKNWSFEVDEKIISEIQLYQKKNLTFSTKKSIYFLNENGKLDKEVKKEFFDSIKKYKILNDENYIVENEKGVYIFDKDDNLINSISNGSFGDFFYIDEEIYLLILFEEDNEYILRCYDLEGNEHWSNKENKYYKHLVKVYNNKIYYLVTDVMKIIDFRGTTLKEIPEIYDYYDIKFVNDKIFFLYNYNIVVTNLFGDKIKTINIDNSRYEEIIDIVGKKILVFDYKYRLIDIENEEIITIENFDSYKFSDKHGSMYFEQQNNDLIKVNNLVNSEKIFSFDEKIVSQLYFINDNIICNSDFKLYSYSNSEIEVSRSVEKKKINSKEEKVFISFDFPNQAKFLDEIKIEWEINIKDEKDKEFILFGVRENGQEFEVLKTNEKEIIYKLNDNSIKKLFVRYKSPSHLIKSEKKEIKIIENKINWLLKTSENKKSSIILVENNIYFAGDELIALKTDGTILWRKNINNKVNKLLNSKDKIYLVLNNGVKCYDMNGEELWFYIPENIDIGLYRQNDGVVKQDGTFLLSIANLIIHIDQNGKKITSKMFRENCRFKKLVLFGDNLFFALYDRTIRRDVLFYINDNFEINWIFNSGISSINDYIFFDDKLFLLERDSLKKIGLNGDLVFSKELDKDYEMLLSDNDNIILFGSNILVLDKFGNEIKNIEERGYNGIIDQEENIYVCGGDYVKKINNKYELLWNKETFDLNSIVLDKKGNMYLVEKNSIKSEKFGDSPQLNTNWSSYYKDEKNSSFCENGKDSEIPIIPENIKFAKDVKLSDIVDITWEKVEENLKSDTVYHVIGIKESDERVYCGSTKSNSLKYEVLHENLKKLQLVAVNKFGQSSFSEEMEINIDLDINWIFEVDLDSKDIFIQDDKDNIYFISKQGILHKIDKNGELIYKKEGFEGDYGLALNDQNIVLYNKNNIKFLDLNSVEIWNVELSNYENLESDLIDGMPSFDYEGNLIFITRYNRIFSLDKSGKINWITKLNRDIYEKVIISNDNTFYVLAEKYLIAFDSSGNFLWESELDFEKNEKLFLSIIGFTKKGIRLLNNNSIMVYNEKQINIFSPQGELIINKKDLGDFLSLDNNYKVLFQKDENIVEYDYSFKEVKSIKIPGDIKGSIRIINIDNHNNKFIEMGTEIFSYNDNYDVLMKKNFKYFLYDYPSNYYEILNSEGDLIFFNKPNRIISKNIYKEFKNGKSWSFEFSDYQLTNRSSLDRINKIKLPELKNVTLTQKGEEYVLKWQKLEEGLGERIKYYIVIKDEKNNTFQIGETFEAIFEFNIKNFDLKKKYIHINAIDSIGSFSRSREIEIKNSLPDIITLELIKKKKNRINGMKYLGENKIIFIDRSTIIVENENGELLWEFDCEKKINEFFVDSDNNVIVLTYNSIIFLDQTGGKLWEKEKKYIFNEKLLINDRLKKIYFFNKSKELEMISYDGKINSLNIKNEIVVNPVLGANELIYVVDVNNNLICFDSNGEINWIKHISTGKVFELAIDKSNNIIILHENGLNFYYANGDLKFKYKTDINESLSLCINESYISFFNKNKSEITILNKNGLLINTIPVKIYNEAEILLSNNNKIILLNKNYLKVFNFDGNLLNEFVLFKESVKLSELNFRMTKENKVEKLIQNGIDEIYMLNLDYNIDKIEWYMGEAFGISEINDEKNNTISLPDKVFEYVKDDSIKRINLNNFFEINGEKLKFYIMGVTNGGFVESIGISKENEFEIKINKSYEKLLISAVDKNGSVIRNEVDLKIIYKEDLEINLNKKIVSNIFEDSEENIYFCTSDEVLNCYNKLGEKRWEIILRDTLMKNRIYFPNETIIIDAGINKEVKIVFYEFKFSTLYKVSKEEEVNIEKLAESGWDVNVNEREVFLETVMAYYNLKNNVILVDPDNWIYNKEDLLNRMIEIKKYIETNNYLKEITSYSNIKNTDRTFLYFEDDIDFVKKIVCYNENLEKKWDYDISNYNINYFGSDFFRSVSFGSKICLYNREKNKIDIIKSGMILKSIDYEIFGGIFMESEGNLYSLNKEGILYEFDKDLNIKNFYSVKNDGIFSINITENKIYISYENGIIRIINKQEGLNSF